MAAYSNPLRRSLKWYRKVALNVLLKINVVNACVLFKKVARSNISITDFRASLVERLTKKEVLQLQNNPDLKHGLEKVGRSRCFKCYQTQRKKVCSAKL